MPQVADLVLAVLRALGARAPAAPPAVASAPPAEPEPAPIAGITAGDFRTTAFFAELRKITGRLDQVQVDTVNGLLVAAAHWPLAWLAYGLATAWHEARFKPQPEWGRGRGRPYAAPGRHGQPQYGRGLVQLTWDDNYEWADAAASRAGLIAPGALLRDFDRALEPGLATFILVKGMEEGAFCKDRSGIPHDLTRYLPRRRPASVAEFTQARRIINVMDKAELIAGLAVRFQQALLAGGWK